MKKWSTRKRVVIALSLLLTGLLGTAGAVGYLAFLRSPANSPAEACADGREPGERPVVVAAGASITQGSQGADWVGALRDRPESRRYEFVNAGVNGNTSADLRERVDTDITACQPAAVTLLIGTNDVRNGVPVKEYENNLGAIVDSIKTRSSARIGLMSLPPLGEDLDAALNQRLRAYNAAIKATASRADVTYLPVHEQMTDFLRRHDGDGTPYDFSFALAYAAAAEHHLLRRSWDQVARGNDLQLLVDHIHLSDRGGAIVTDIAAQWLAAPGKGAGPVDTAG
ncbi:SGNH/GDSL hydrolase family protein [Streptomyces sp. NPDC102467]|uniref:SGNH/GDSL hydrolase family protein n=1 Tax=Streptomyces sp. NPDC102467 TaxID=3366179 RepID=UPI0037F76184